MQTLRRRPNVDGNRLGIIGYGEGAAVALLAARREDRIRAVALVAAPAVGGHALTLEQQESLLDRLHVPLEERAAKIALQKRVLDATESGEGWDKIPFELRRQADSVTFRSWLRFDPGPVIQRLEQPLLILHGALDEEINPTHADRLETLAQARRNVPPAHSRKVVLPGVTHQLAHTESGEAGARVAAEPVDALATWLGEVLPPR